MSLLAQPTVFAVPVGHHQSLPLCFAPAAENLPLKTEIRIQSYSVGYSVPEQNAFPPPPDMPPSGTSMPLLVIQGWGKASLIPREL